MVSSIVHWLWLMCIWRRIWVRTHGKLCLTRSASARNRNGSPSSSSLSAAQSNPIEEQTEADWILGKNPKRVPGRGSGSLSQLVRGTLTAGNTPGQLCSCRVWGEAACERQLLPLGLFLELLVSSEESQVSSLHRPRNSYYSSISA